MTKIIEHLVTIYNKKFKFKRTQTDNAHTAISNELYFDWFLTSACLDFMSLYSFMVMLLYFAHEYEKPRGPCSGQDQREIDLWAKREEKTKSALSMLFSVIEMVGKKLVSRGISLAENLEKV